MEAENTNRERLGTAGAAFFLGAVAVAGQVVLLREVLGLVGGNELSFGLTLAIWLVSAGVGSLVFGGAGGKSPVLLIAVFLLAPAAYLLTLYLIWGGRAWLGAAPGELISVGRALPFLLAALSPLPFLTGAGFVFVAGATSDTARRAYAGEALGSAAGGVVLSFLLAAVLGPIATGVALTLISAVGAAVWTFTRKGIRVPGVGAALLLVAGTVVLIAFTPRIKTEMWYDRVYPGYDVLGEARSAYGAVVAVDRSDQRSLFQNGLLIATYPDVQRSEESVHFAMLQHPAPRRVVLVGGGLSGALAEIAKYKTVEEITYVELDPTLPPFTAEYFGYDPLAEPKVRFVPADGRRWSRRARAANEKYDVIILAMPDPATAAVNRFYTAEFFADVRDLLGDAGVFGLTTASAQNYYTDAESDYLRSVYATLKDVFENTAAVPVDSIVFLASNGPELDTDAAFFDMALGERGIVNEYYRGARVYADRTEPASVIAHEVFGENRMPGGIEEPGDAKGTATIRTVTSAPGVIGTIITPDRKADLKRVLAEPGTLNRDFNPTSYYFAMTLWAAKTGGWEKTMLMKARGLELWHLVVGTVLLTGFWLVIRKRTPAWTGRATVAAVTVQGAAEISLEIMIILGFQSVFGSSYLEVALVVAAFMAGLAVGSWYYGARALKKALDDRQNIVNILGFTAVVAVGLTPVLYVVAKWGVLLPDVLIHVVFLLLASVAGAAGGLQFPAAVRLLEKTGRSGSAGLLYGVDLIGSAAGAVAVSILIIPIMGFARTGLFLAAVLGAAMILMSSTLPKKADERG
jgi:spermidine synthase